MSDLIKPDAAGVQAGLQPQPASAKQTPGPPDPRTPGPPDLNTQEGRAQHNVQMALINPSAVPDKFKNADGTVDVNKLTASYKALEQRLGSDPSQQRQSGEQKSVEAASSDSLGGMLTGDSTGDSKDGEASSFAEALNGPAVDTSKPNKIWEQAQKDLASTGTLQKTTIESLKKAGVPDAVLQSSVAGFQAKQQQDLQKGAKLVGGIDRLKATFEWIKANTTVEARQQIVEQLQGSQGETLLLGLAARAEAAGALPEKGSLVDTSLGGPSMKPDSNVGIKPFSHMSEMQAAMTDSRYATDPVYRRQIQKRLIVGVGGDPAALDKSPIQ